MAYLSLCFGSLKLNNPKKGFSTGLKSWRFWISISDEILRLSHERASKEIFDEKSHVSRKLMAFRQDHFPWRNGGSFVINERISQETANYSRRTEWFARKRLVRWRPLAATVAPRGGEARRRDWGAVSHSSRSHLLGEVEFPWGRFFLFAENHFGLGVERAARATSFYVKGS